MATMAEILAKKAAEAAGAIPSHPKALDMLKPAADQLGGIASGMQANALPESTQAPKPLHEKNEEKAKAAIAVFEDSNLRHFVNVNGQRVKAVNGFFYAETEEDVAMLKNYEARGYVKEV